MSGGTIIQTRVVLVTGASAGVGRAVARELAGPGTDIGLVARDTAGLDAAVREVEEKGGRALALPCDVADPDALELAASTLERAFGPIDVWINNAMLSVFSPVRLMRADEYRRVTEVTYLGYVYGTLTALRRMLPRDHGTIVQVGSALAYRGIPLQSAYCGAKHAIVGFTESLRCELFHDRSAVRVTLVHLPAMNTPQFGWVRSRLPRKPQPVPPIYQPEVGARAIVKAIDDTSRETWVAAPTWAAIIGNRLFPGFYDRILALYGYDSQQTREPADPDRRDNLDAPLPGDHGAHGTFDNRALVSADGALLRTIGGWIRMAVTTIVEAIAGRFVPRRERRA
jgi:NAD(P)-dependent dehydrogenase (short-subunit alcohol dehydrogenase family)